MAIKSIVDIDIDPKGNFKAFSEVFDKYQKALAQSPTEWAKVTAKIGSSKQAFDALVKQQIAANAQTRLLAEASKAADLATRTMGDRWKEIGRTTSAVSRDFKAMATNLKDATLSLVKWASVTSVVSGLLGVGGLFGLDRLAGSVGNNRRTSLGLGGTYGGTQSFGVNFSRFVEPSQFLSSVADAKFDVSKRIGLYGAGLTEGEINAPTEQTSAALLRNLAKIADNTNPAFYGQVIASRQLGAFADPQLLERLRNTPRDERDKLFSDFGKDSNAFGIQGSVTRKWQEFSTQMSRAGQSIENVLVTGLGGLADPLTKLSNAFAEVVKSLLGSKGFTTLIEEASVKIGEFADYVGGDDFKANLKDAADAVSGFAKAAVAAGKWLNDWFGGAQDPNQISHTAEGAVGGLLLGGPVGAVVGGAAGYYSGGKVANFLNSPFDPFGISNSIYNITGGRLGNKGITRGDRNNNPGNMEYGPLAVKLGAIGSDGRFAIFPSKDAGQKAMEALLRKNYSGLSLEQIENKWVGNYDPAYIASMSKSTGLSPSQVPNLSDPAMMNKLMIGMSGGEGTHIMIHNNTGGNAVVSAAGASGAAAATSTATN